MRVNKFAINLFFLFKLWLAAFSQWKALVCAVPAPLSLLTFLFCFFFSVTYSLLPGSAGGGDAIIKTHFWLFFFWLYQFPHAAHNAAFLAAGGKACHDTGVEQASDSRNIL